MRRKITNLRRHAPEPISVQLKAEVHDAIVAWARDMAGTDFDLDAGLESAAIEHLLESGRWELGNELVRQKRRRPKAYFTHSQKPTS